MSTYPVRAVLTNPELLQYILLQCDLRLLLTAAQRVCRLWHAAVATSPEIQKHLYFQPVANNTEQTPAQLTTNPLLRELFSHWMRRSRPETGFVTRDEMLTLPIADAARRDAFLRSNASWRRMLVAQPAVTSLGLLKQLPRIREYFAHLQEQIFYPEGLRMGELVDLTIQIIKEERGYATFRVAWSRPFGQEEYLSLLLQQFNRGLMSFGPEVELILLFMLGRPWVPTGEELPDRWPEDINSRFQSEDFQARALVLNRLPSGYESQGMAFYQQ